jgi:Uma2 family endonuclease
VRYTRAVASPVRKPASYDDLLRLPEDRIGEIVDGELHASPRRALAHAGAAFELSSDWVCEILSPSTERLDRAKKLPAYARHEVGHAWLLNLAARTLEVFRREGPRWVLLGAFADDARVRVEPFEALELDLLPLWGETRPTSGP